METQIGLIAAGKADKVAVVEHTLQQFVQKFLFFSENVSRMDVLFEANFAPLTASGMRLCCAACCARADLHFRMLYVMHALSESLATLDDSYVIHVIVVALELS